MSPVNTIRNSLNTHDDWEELIKETRKLLRAARSAQTRAMLEVCEHSTMLGALREGFEQWKAIHGEEILEINGPAQMDLERAHTTEESEASQDTGPQNKRQRRHSEVDEDGPVSMEEKEMEEDEEE